MQKRWSTMASSFPPARPARPTVTEPLAVAASIALRTFSELPVLLQEFSGEFRSQVLRTDQSQALDVARIIQQVLLDGYAVGCVF